MPAQSFGGGAAASGGGGGGGGSASAAAAAGASSGGGAAAPPRQRQRARRGQATDPHSIAERVYHSPTTFPFSPPFFIASMPCCVSVFFLLLELHKFWTNLTSQFDLLHTSNFG